MSESNEGLETVITEWTAAWNEAAVEGFTPDAAGFRAWLTQVELADGTIVDAARNTAGMPWYDIEAEILKRLGFEFQPCVGLEAVIRRWMEAWFAAKLNDNPQTFGSWLVICNGHGPMSLKRAAEAAGVPWADFELELAKRLGIAGYTLAYGPTQTPFSMVD